MNPSDKRKIKAAMDACLTGVDALPSRRADILRAAKGEKKMKRKMNLGLIFALILVLFTTSVAVAAELGLFGFLAQQEDADTRLTGLDAAATPVALTYSTPGGVTVTVYQSYYDGSRVFISYTVEGAYDQREFGEGDPGVAKYDMEFPGEKYGESFGEFGEAGKKMSAWLDGSAPRWAKVTHVNVHDNLDVGDETLNIIGSGEATDEQGRLICWKECEVPAEIAADELTVAIGIYTTQTTYYQTADGLYMATSRLGETAWPTFTVKKDTSAVTLHAQQQTDTWTAEADMTVSAIDVNGTIRMTTCPDSWKAYFSFDEAAFNAANTDVVTEWLLYEDGVPTEEWDLNGGVGGDPLTYYICYRINAETEELKFVPVYRNAGEKPEEAIILNIK